ncbi:hypothetical protein Pint_34459 [Pistacia integerrima]|uniref:Uncharacterized protein n=1 Tax=Pistacia integerrima TaxID=434235 RepID=A0ACC0X7U3_9ROSI|nr:hypothetical protein Pint_34459 [Pistacia integerrima]
MPFPTLQIYRSFSRLSSPNDAHLADKALTFLRRHPYQLNSLSSDFTSEAALILLLRTQSDQTLTLNFLKWAQPHPFFTPKLKCLTLHILTKFKLYKSAQTLAQSLAVSLTNDEGSIVFSCLKDTYHLCDSSSSSAVFDLVVKSYASLHMIDKALNIVNLAKVEEALGVIQGMVEKGLTPDVVSYCTIISGFCRNQEWDKAFEMKQQMVEKGVPLDAITYSTLIQGLCDKRRLAEACNLFQEMLNSGLAPDEITYTTLINAYCTEGDISKAFHLHDEMIQKGFLPDVVTYSVLINGLNKRARTKEAKRLLLKLFYHESVPTDVTYNTLIENCSNIEFKSVVALLKGFCMKGLMNEADQVFESMLQRNHKPNEAVYDIIIHGHSSGGNVQKGYELYKEMVHSGFVPHTVTIIALVKALFMAGMNEELSLVVGNTLRSCRLTDAELAKVLVEINHKEGNMDAVLNVLTEMAKDGLLPNSGRSTNRGE